MSNKGENMKHIILLFLLIPTLAFSQLEIGSYSIPEDKMYHYFAGVAITSISHDLIWEKTKSKEKAIIYSMATALVVSTLKEVFVDYRKFDGDDIAAGMAGAITVGFTIELDDLIRKLSKKKSTK